VTANPSAASVFRGLHERGFLILPNAWDAGSARLIESAGARAIATSSAAVAWSHGYPDGDVLPAPLLLATVAAIARVVKVPVSADIEGGYSADPVRVGELVTRVIDAGAVGINIEDGTASPDLLCAKIERIRAAASAAGVPLFVNARTDVYLESLVPEDRRVAESIARAARYRDAGADGIFVPGVVDSNALRAIVAGVTLPLNVLARPGLPPARALEALGARRLSAGSGIASALFGSMKTLAEGFLRDGDSRPLGRGAMRYADTNALMPKG
jgi:2-methylisocitrate lyase-like PEP mutase family enzyme